MTLANKFFLISLSLLFCFPAIGQQIPKEAKSKKDSVVTTVKRKMTAADIAYEEQYQINILKTRIDGNYIPKDLFDAFKQLELVMGPELVNQYRSLPEERAGKKIRVIMWMIESWYFRQGSRLSHNIRSVGITHPEHMGHFILITFHRHLNKKDLDIKERVTFYKIKEKEAADKTRKIMHEEKRKREE